RPFIIESKFIVFNELLQVVATMCFLPPGEGVTDVGLTPSHPEGISHDDVKYMLLLLSIESPDPWGKALYAQEYHIRPKDWIEEFLEILEDWQFPLPSFKLLYRNSIQLIENPWFHHFCPSLQNFLRLEDIDGKSLTAKYLSRKPDIYQSQQDMLYDDTFYRKLTSEGRKFISHFEGLFSEKVFHSGIDEQKFEESLITSITSEINIIFMESLKDVNHFFQIIDDSTKIVNINNYIDVRYVNGESLIYIYSGILN
ncbi:MAG: hypothetical protein ACTSUC_08935, partial [Promethearchaeota archaeon]